MDNRFVTSAAAAAMATVTLGCASGSAALLETHAAQVLINGNDAGRHLVECSQVQWLWNIKTLEDNPGFTAQVQTGDPVVARSVQINNVGGFTGSFWELTTGNAEASLERGTFTITGTAEGFYHHDPDERSSATFEITTDC